MNMDEARPLQPEDLPDDLLAFLMAPNNPALSDGYKTLIRHHKEHHLELDDAREEISLEVELLKQENANLKAKLANAPKALRTIDDAYIATLTQVIKELGPCLPYNKLIAALDKFESDRAALGETKG